MRKIINILANPVVRYYRNLKDTLFSGNLIDASSRIMPGAWLRHARVDAYASVGHDVWILNGHVGAYSYISNDAKIAYAKIGKFCSIGSRVVIAPGMHPVDQVSTHPIFYSTGGQCATTWVDRASFCENQRVNIGNDVWLGLNAVVLDGVTIGTGAIVAAGALVVADVPPYAVVGGVPAKLIKYRFDERTINRLLESQWWDIDPDELRGNVEKFMGGVDIFLRWVDGRRRGCEE